MWEGFQVKMPAFTGKILKWLPKVGLPFDKAAFVLGIGRTWVLESEGGCSCLVGEWRGPYL